MAGYGLFDDNKTRRKPFVALSMPEHDTIVEPLVVDWERRAESKLTFLSGDSAYMIGKQIACGGMGSVHLGMRRGVLGLERLLAVKRLHVHLAQDPLFVAQFADEIRIVTRLRHPNLVQTIDVIECDDGFALVMDFIEGVTLSEMLKDARIAGEQLPSPIVSAIIAQALYGLHAAHEASDRNGQALSLVHRDVSPQNIMIGADGLVRVLDFGVAKAASNLHTTRTGQLTGKAGYMSPEQVKGRSLDRRTDVFAAGIVLWEALSGARLFRDPSAMEAATMLNILSQRVPRLSEYRHGINPALDDVVLRALERDPTGRFSTAEDFAVALERVAPPATVSAVSSLLRARCSPRLERQAELVETFRNDVARLYEVGTELPDLSRPSMDVTSVDPQGALTGTERCLHTGVRKTLDAAPVSDDAAAVSNTSPAAILRRRRRAAVLLGTAGVSALLLGGLSLVVSPTPTLQQSPRADSPAKALVEVSPRALGSAMSTPRVAVKERADIDTDTADVPIKAATGAWQQPPGQSFPPATSTTKIATPQRRKASSRLPRTSPPPLLRQAKSGPLKEAPEPDANCSPPMYTDPEGIRHFKRECL